MRSSFCLWMILSLTATWPLAPAYAQTPPVADVPHAFTIPDDVEVVKDLQYCTGGGHPLLLNIYKPKTSISRSTPAILWIHGGGWRIGGKDNSSQAVAFAEHGFIAASIDYRLSGEAPFPAAIEDSKCAVRYLRANAAKYGIDPTRIGAAGSSAGGHLALLVGTAPPSAGLEGTGGWNGVSSRVSAVVSWYGPADFSVGPTSFERGKGPSIIAFLDGTPKQRPENYKNASPTHWVARGDPPLLMFHGEDDTTVPFDQSVRMQKAYQKKGLDAQLVEVKNAGHNFDQDKEKPISPTYAEILKQTIEFFQRTLSSDDAR